MKVQRVETQNGSAIKPALKDYWSDKKKLEWKAAVLEADYGVVVQVDDSNYSTKRFGVWVPNPGYYTVFGVGPLSYRSAWDFMVGLGLGYEAGKNAS